MRLGGEWEDEGRSGVAEEGAPWWGRGRGEEERRGGRTMQSKDRCCTQKDSESAPNEYPGIKNNRMNARLARVRRIGEELADRSEVVQRDLGLGSDGGPCPLELSLSLEARFKDGGRRCAVGFQQCSQPPPVACGLAVEEGGGGGSDDGEGDYID